MNCAEFLSWLDTPAEAPQPRAAHAHAASCERCAQQWAAAQRIDELLAAPLPSARAGLAAQVLHRVRESGAPELQTTAVPVVPGESHWRQFLSEPAILFSGIAGCMGLAFALFAALPGTAARVRPGLAALRQLSLDGAQVLSGMTPDAILWTLLACAALAAAAWFATQGTTLRTR